MRSKTAAKDSVYANDEDDEQDDETTSLTARADAGSAARSDDDGGDGESGAVTPLPTKVMFALVATAITEGFQMNVIWSFLPFMVEDLGHPGPSEQLGLWTGLMASSFFGGQIFASLIWPPLSDRIGRRKCLLFGQGTLTLCMLGFGFSRSYWPALAYRVVAGLLQGNQAIRKALLADITDKTNQAKAFSWMPFAWGLSSIVAPLVGGFLSRPCVNYPGLWLTADPSALLCVFPYALPCLVMSAIATASIICGFFWLPEEGKVTWCGAGLAVLAAPCRACQRSKRGGHATGEGDMEGMEIEGPPPPSFWRILRAPWVGGTILCYGYTSALNILFDELFPLFGKAAEGTAGLGFGTQQIGLFQTARGIFFVSYMPTINPIIQHKAGLVQCYRAGSVLAIAVFFACPFIARLAPSGAAYVWTALIGLALANVVCTGLTFLSINILVNNAADRRFVGRTQGVSTSLAAAMRCISPTIGGAIWSATAGLDYPLHPHLTYVCICCLALVNLRKAWQLPLAINQPIVGVDWLKTGPR